MVKKRRRDYKQYEARLIQLLRRRFTRPDLKVEDRFKTGKLPLEIDLIVCRKSKAQAKASSTLPPLFKYFRRYNVLELKTEHKPLRPSDLLKLQAYAWLYMEKHEIYSASEVTATVIAHHLTPAVMAVLPALVYRFIKSFTIKF